MAIRLFHKIRQQAVNGNENPRTGNFSDRKLLAKDAKVSLDGKAIIPKGTVKIGYKAFDRNENVRSVFVPGTVKSITTGGTWTGISVK